jgi:hypothetical protein
MIYQTDASRPDRRAEPKMHDRVIAMDSARRSA